jgi:LysR family hydrogen peroxide-inducible transcriptional activator
LGGVWKQFEAPPCAITLRKSDDMISVRQLRYLDAIARHGHFGRAVDAVAVSQPALSMQIKELETTLDLQLVERGPKGASLTTDGL